MRSFSLTVPRFCILSHRDIPLQLLSLAMKHAFFCLGSLALLPSSQAALPHDVRESQLQHRDPATTLPAPLSLGPSQFWDGNDGQWTSYILRLGAPTGQVVRVLPSTQSPAIWAISTYACKYAENFYPSIAEDANKTADCQDNRGGVFDYQKSVGWVAKSTYPLHVDEYLEYRDGANGDIGFDQVGLDWSGASGSATLDHQVIASTYYERFWFGVLPLYPRPVNLSEIDHPQPSLMESLKSTGYIPSLSWGYTAGAKYRSENFFGSLTLGGYDNARFSNNSQVVVDFAADQERALTVQVNSITTTSSETPLVSQKMNMLIDSTVPYIFLPDFAYQAFEKEFNLVWNDTARLYLLNETTYKALVEKDAEISLNIGSSAQTTTITFPIGAFLLNASYPLVPGNQSQYYFPIMRANTSDQWTLGRAFLQEAYVIADFEQNKFTLAPCIWPQDSTDRPASSPVIIFPANHTGSQNDSSTQEHTPSTGAIAGAVVGGVVAGLFLAGLIALLLIRRRRRGQDSNSKASSVAHTRSSSSATLTTNGRPRAGSRLASFFRNPWGSDAASPLPGLCELPVDPSSLTPLERDMAAREREHKRQLSNELDAEVSAVHEMYQPKAVVPEMQGDEPFPTYVSGDGSTIEGNALRAARDEAERERLQPQPAVYEMDATAGLSSASTPIPSPPMPSPGQLGAIAQKERDERERLEAERAEAERVRVEEMRRRVSGGSVDVIQSADGASGPGAERRVSDLSPISESSGFARSPTSPHRPDAGSRRVSRD
ncbi:aspartic peptidase domain-containing protein [Macrophomina phaseolina]|uniref:Aspartic peptidase domain-containing protein n=1 Tax=Macrophomina phaseolina TaxID=35725 RepID=A0ABQ8FVP4_9PEZI|nr:aspartic peptidase domain-containing protein [Macrophomina phaseolina]